MTDSFWTRVLWSRFIKHFRKLTDEQIIKDIHESMDALEDNDASGDSFGAKMVAWTNERRNEKAAIASRENGNLGGRPRKNQDTTADGDTREDSHDEKSGTSAKVYDQVAYHSISTDEKPAGGQLLPSSSRPPVGNRHASVDVLNLAYAGEFGNVRLTQEQYAQLGIKFGNQQKLNRAIDSLSCQIENGEKNPANHYAELVKWANYRDDMDERKIQQSEAPKMTEMEKSWIREAEKIARYEKELAANERR